MICRLLVLRLDPCRELVERDPQGRRELGERTKTAAFASHFDLAQVTRRDAGGSGERLAAEAAVRAPNAHRVLAVYHPQPVMVDPRPYAAGDVISKGPEPTKTLLPPTQYLNIPPERSGLLFVFRVFDRVAYAVVLNTTDPVFPGDVVRKP